MTWTATEQGDLVRLVTRLRSRPDRTLNYSNLKETQMNTQTPALSTPRLGNADPDDTSHGIDRGVLALVTTLRHRSPKDRTTGVICARLGLRMRVVLPALLRLARAGRVSGDLHDSWEAATWLPRDAVLPTEPGREGGVS